ncbi:MAG: hypothetical protein UT66_C0037G0005 [candidate division CPR2 bacterium GW2011_GWC1_39_9]|nr:MAG: hypothetical protein UT66_C0037G0005 [candidate division CPR2 bacterium GW2011_GWC1_39_9]
MTETKVADLYGFELSSGKDIPANRGKIFQYLKRHFENLSKRHSKDLSDNHDDCRQLAGELIGNILKHVPESLYPAQICIKLEDEEIAITTRNKACWATVKEFMQKISEHDEKTPLEYLMEDEKSEEWLFGGHAGVCLINKISSTTQTNYDFSNKEILVISTFEIDLKRN